MDHPDPGTFPDRNSTLPDKYRKCLQRADKTEKKVTFRKWGRELRPYFCEKNCLRFEIEGKEYTCPEWDILI